MREKVKTLSISFRVAPETYEMLKEVATADNRSITNEFEYMVKQAYKKIKNLKS